MYLPPITEIKLTKKELIIYNFIITNISSIPIYTETDIAKFTNVSQPSISRFWKKVGYLNFKELKDKIKSSINAPSPSEKFKSTLSSEKYYYKNYVNHSIDLLSNLAHNLNEENFNKAVTALAASNRVFTHSIGPSQSLTSLLIFRLRRFGYNISSIPETGQAIYEHLINISKGDLIILNLFSHYHPETYVILNYANKHDITVILITDNEIKIDNDNVILLYLSRGELFEFHSLISPLFLIESLIVSVGIIKKDESLKKLNDLENLRNDYEPFIPRNFK